MAICTTTGGPIMAPSNPADDPCNKPMFRPRRAGDELSIINDCDIGKTGPSAIPINARKASRPANPPISPDAAEKKEKPSTAATSSDLRRLWASDHAPARVPDRAHVNESTDDAMPNWACVSFNSADMNGKRNDRARRSKKTKPTVMNNMASSLFSSLGARVRRIECLLCSVFFSVGLSKQLVHRRRAESHFLVVVPAHLDVRMHIEIAGCLAVLVEPDQRARDDEENPHRFFVLERNQRVSFAGRFVYEIAASRGPVVFEIAPFAQDCVSENFVRMVVSVDEARRCRRQDVAPFVRRR